ncbi:EAL domain-containing protein [Nitrosomonas oligotropha]|uniref:EAL domain, c-di-GMP-specific phosphodiesterase class I (Or its enzymatically inactive variant) n=1 Tax=Nitrosomonas oligotropha TaxID=42354 RepID=A0A1H8TAD8_9PROT|nr:EAL domain-containing protein [Nitrosomonas oligotropha]SDX23815.1 EAL domain, c-di-GMP-specific phosphodiesterase class I (or its enzymatically inactive variant) [Nitrosomonas oligotropha]SEO88060.1 EAL domain, c-di-GMP-specific phosphodiesterase class I (or its enzymatically inactive variant) [Nitrosomonas oligotropha]
MNTSANNTFTALDEFELINSATDYALKRADNGWISGYFYQCELTSVFQPIFSIDLGKTIAHAAYVRSKSNEEIALWPWQVFAMASKDDQLIELDRLCRAIHALNYYFNHTSQSDNLFVEVHPRLLESVKDDHGRAFENFLDLIGVKTSRVVIEIPAIVNRNWKLLQHVIGNYRSRGYRIAANYSGTNSDWMAELGSLYPDVVRIAASDLMRHETIAELANTVHSFGASLLVRDIETAEQLAAAKRTEADYLQGNLLGKPLSVIKTTELTPASRPVN